MAEKDLFKYVYRIRRIKIKNKKKTCNKCRFKSLIMDYFFALVLLAIFVLATYPSLSTK